MQEKLMLLMKEKSLTNKDMANILGISSKQFSLKLNGKNDFKSSEMFKISEYFGKKVDEIFLSLLYQNGTKQSTQQQN